MKWAPLAVASACAAACLPDQEAPPTCDDAAGECPRVSRDATAVACDCTCEIAVSVTKKRVFRGDFETCLPPEMNRRTASPAQLEALEAMTDQSFGRRIFGLCSERVVDFVETVTRGQIGDRAAALCLPGSVTCRCVPRRAWRDGEQCDYPCPEIDCTKATCAPVLRERETLYTDACVCSRVRSCGRDVPAAEESALCRYAPHP